MALLSPSVIGAVLSVVLLGGYLLYRATFFTPIPGIPYVKASAERPFGDVPDALKYSAETSELMSFLTTKCIELNSPIVQVFMRPFSRPWVVLVDSAEAQDIMVRRTREFDRSAFFGDLLVSTVPHNQVTMRTNDQWRSNRRLMAETMSTQFLHSAAAQQIYSAFLVLVELWRRKGFLAPGHPTSVTADIEEAMLDAITSVAFGTSTGAVNTQLDLVNGLPKLDELSKEPESMAVFPRAPAPAESKAISMVANSSEIPMHSPLGRAHHKFATKYYPALSAAMKLKHDMVVAHLHAAWKKFDEAGSSDNDVRSAADLIVSKEVALAKKEGRTPEHDSPTVQDELFGFIQAGHDTTGTTIEWGLCFLTQHQEVQHKLRQSLQESLQRATGAKETPSADEIAKTSLPYLDAVLEEILRCGCTSAASIRVATVDVEVLGHRIPEGTDIFMPNIGPSFKAPALPVDDSKRSKTSQQSLNTNWTGKWDVTTLGEFMPDRWLVKNESGEVEFDPRAGPQQTFGAGLRMCFGRKLALLSLRIAFALIIWNFKLEPLPKDLTNVKAKDVLTHRPQQVYLRLATA